MAPRQDEARTAVAAEPARAAANGRKQASAPAGDKTLTKGLQLLEALARCDGARGITELAHELSLTKSNVHRLLQTLIRSGYVTREPSTERYVLSSKLWQMSRQGRPYDALRRLARPLLRGFVEETSESVLFCVLEHDELIPIDQVETHYPVRVFFTIGEAFPIDRVIMSGKALTALQLTALAHRPQAEARLALRKVQKQLQKGAQFGERQMTQLAEIRKSGFAMSLGEWVSGANAVAVPMRDGAGDLIGVLSCFGPADRLSETRLRKIQKVLARTAEELARRVGA